MTFLLVGGGPTGVELAGTLAEIARQTRAEFRNIDTRTTRIVLIEAGPTILPSFAPALRDAARRSLAVGDVSAAVNLFGRAFSLSEPADRDGAEALLELAFALVPLGDLSHAKVRYEEAMALAQRLGHGGRRLH